MSTEYSVMNTQIKIKGMLTQEDLVIIIVGIFVGALYLMIAKEIIGAVIVALPICLSRISINKIKLGTHLLNYLKKTYVRKIYFKTL